MGSPIRLHASHQAHKSYPSNPASSRDLRYSGYYPGVKSTVQEHQHAYQQQMHRHSIDRHHQGQRFLSQHTSEVTRQRHQSKASLPGLSSLLTHPGGSPPQHTPRRADASLADFAPCFQRTTSWSSNGSPTESPPAGHGGSRRPDWEAAVLHQREQEIRNAYGPYYHHQQRLSEPQFRHQYTNGALKKSASAPASRSPSSLSGDDASTPAAGPAGNKNSRYLREMDRRTILERLANGEKQAALAKEFQVSRAAICNLNKHRDEVMSRSDENPFAKHPKKRKTRPFVKASPPPVHEEEILEAPLPTGSSVSTDVTETMDGRPGGAQATAMAAVHVVQSRAVQLLLTTLRSQMTPLGEFRRCSERVMRLVIEDALALVPTKPVDVYLNDQVKVEGVGMKNTPCGISMEQRHCPMMDMFHLIEPDQPTGYVRLGGEPASITLLDAHLPQDLRFHNVFLFDLVAASSETICATIQQLKDRGAIESMVHVVALFVSSSVVATVQCTFPTVQIITAQIDASLSKKTQRGSNLDSMLARFAQVYGDVV